MRAKQRSWLEAIPAVIDIPRRESDTILDWPTSAKVRAFDQCYAVLREAVRRNNVALTYLYTDWIEKKLGPPYDKLIQKAERLGWPKNLKR